MKKWTSITLASVLSTSMILSGLPTVSQAANYKTAKEAVKSLTDSQRSLIKKIDPTPSFVIDPSLLKERGEKVKVIVELKQASLAEAVNSATTFSLTQKEKFKKEQKTKIEKEQATFKTNIQKIFKDKKLTTPTITYTYKTTFNGVSLEIPTTEIKTLLETGVVKRIWKDTIVQLPPDKLTTKNENIVKLPAPLPVMGIDKLHGENVNGKGIKVAVLDTGIDYNHPDLKDAYKGGYDFVDKDNDPMEATPADWKKSGWPEVYNGSTYYTSHGTHVSGTIASNPQNNVEYAMTGVAPNVDLYVYRVLGPYGSGAISGIIAAIEKSVEQGMDVINLSLGSPNNQSLTPDSIAINNAARLGVVPIVAAGNSGAGAATLGSPGTSPLAITVGASTVPTNVPTTTITFGDKSAPGKLLGSDYGDDEKQVLNKPYGIVQAGLGYPADFDGKDFKGKIALIQRGELGLADKVTNAKKAGAVAVIMYNNVDGEIPHFLGDVPNSLPAFKLTKADGESLVAALSTNPALTLSIGNLSDNIEPGDTLADFSSRGPVTDNYDIKPDVVAPGVSILSTYPEFIYSPEDGVDYTKAYSSISGTSMATPHVAGVAALILQAHPEYSVSDVKAALANTADPLAKKYNVYEVGAGRVDAYEAVHANNLVQVMDKTNSVNNNGDIIQIDDITSSLGFGAIFESNRSETKTLPIQLTNMSPTEENFDVSVEFLNLTNQSGSSLDAASNGVTLSVDKTVTVSANGAKVVNATLTIPSTAAIGMYQGYVYFKNKANPDEVFQVPFAVKHTQKGFAYGKTDRYAASNNFENYHPTLYPFVNGILKLNSPMKTIDLVISDLKTKKPLGYLGQLDASGALPEIEYFLMWMFQGFYYPITDNTIGKPQLLPEGEYTLSYIGTDESGATYEVGNPLIIDNTKPVIKYNNFQGPGIHEVSKKNLTVEKDDKGVEHEALWFHGNIYDSTVKRLAELGYQTDFYGYPMDQSVNGIVVYQDSSFPTANLLPNKNGDFKFGVLWDELAEHPTSLALYSYDYATAGDFNLDQYLIAKKNQAYSTVTYSKNRVKVGDKFIATVSVENAKNLTSTTFDMYIGDQYKVKPTLNPDFVAAARRAGGKVKITDLSDEFNYKYKVELTNGISLSGDLPVLNLNATVVNEYYDGDDGFTTWQKFTYTNKTGVETKIPSFTKGFQFIPKSSAVELYLGGAEALQENWSVDYTKIGARAWLVDKKGKFYDATVDRQGIASFKGIPIKNDEYKLYVDVPGHFLYASPIKLSKLNNSGDKVGISLRWYTDSIAAGDINRDGIINQTDESLIRNAFGTGGNTVVADLNKDNVVDENDVAFVTKNMNLRNPYPVVKKEIKK